MGDRAQQRPPTAPAPAQRFPHGGGKGLLAAWLLYSLCWWFFWKGLLGSTPVMGVSLICLVTYGGCLYILDWRDYTTLYGYLDWGRMGVWQRVFAALLYANLFLCLPLVYLLIATARHHRAVGMTPRQYLGHAGRGFQGATGWLQVGISAGAVIAVIAFCLGATAAIAGGWTRRRPPSRRAYPFCARRRIAGVKASS